VLKHSMFVSLVATAAYAMWLAKRIGPAMWAYRSYIFHVYGQTIATYALIFMLTLTIATMLIGRYIWLKDTGSKLQHATKELQDGHMAKTQDVLYTLMKAKK
jgi:hypothetical protein